MSLTSPLRRVLGLGAAKEGASHWWSQRVTSVALVVLSLWLAYALLTLDDYSHASVMAWIGEPFSAVMLVLTVATAAYHSQLGVQVVVEDYVTEPWIKVATLLLLNFVHVALAALGIFAVLHVALT